MQGTNISCCIYVYYININVHTRYNDKMHALKIRSTGDAWLLVLDKIYCQNKMKKLIFD